MSGRFAWARWGRCLSPSLSPLSRSQPFASAYPIDGAHTACARGARLRASRWAGPRISGARTSQARAPHGHGRAQLSQRVRQHDAPPPLRPCRRHAAGLSACSQTARMLPGGWAAGSSESVGIREARRTLLPASSTRCSRTHPRAIGGAGAALARIYTRVARHAGALRTAAVRQGA